MRVGRDAAAAALAGRRSAPCRARRPSRRTCEQAVSTSTGHAHLDALQRVLERERDLRPRGRRRARAAARAARPKPPPAAAEEPAEEIAEIEVDELRRPPPPPPGRGRSSTPNVSYCLALLGVREHVVGALDLLEPRLVAAALSGWCSRASLRYAFLISSAEAFLGTPRVSYRVAIYSATITRAGPEHAGRRAGSPSAAPGAPSPPRRPRRAARAAPRGRAGRRRRSVLDLGEPVPLEQRRASERCTSWTPSSSFASSCSAAASSARSRSSSTGRSSFSSRSFARCVSSACSRATRLR